MSENEIPKASEKQVYKLKTLGVPEQEAKAMNMQQASDRIDKLLTAKGQAPGQQPFKTEQPTVVDMSTALAGLLIANDRVVEHITDLREDYEKKGKSWLVDASEMYRQLINAYSRMAITKEIGKNKTGQRPFVKRA